MADIHNGFSEENESRNKIVLKDITEPEKSSEKAKRSLKSFLNNFKIHKTPGQKAPFKANSKVLFAILAVICVALVILSTVNEKFAKPFKAAASYIVVPAQSGINSVGVFFSDKIKLFNTIDALIKENEELKAEIQELNEQNHILMQQQEELKRLENLLELKTAYADYPSTGARIISKDSSNWFSSFVINKGTKDGIQKNMNVVSNGGLVGIITDVGLNFANVRTIINDDTNISGMFDNTTDLCIVSGNMELMSQNMINFSDVSSKVAIHTGDRVVTSYVSSVYLPGLIIGTVTDYSLDGSELTQSGHITPAVDFDNLSEVLIITQLKEISD